MANRNRTNPMQFYLSDDEQYILNTKFKASGMKSMSAFLRKLILYGYVYAAKYSEAKEKRDEMHHFNGKSEKRRKYHRAGKALYGRTKAAGRGLQPDLAV